ncbi:MAG: aldo/keto reductase [Gammaproteobacteria bacterium]|nr:aldo/keto reductase [Gammaproteobacteria bacterium]
MRDEVGLRRLGGTGRLVYPIGFGAMGLSIDGRPIEDRAHLTLEAFLDGGGTFIDTANVYCFSDEEMGHSERLIRRCLNRRADRDDITVATKGGMRRPDGRWVADGRPAWIRKSCERSLKALGVDTIDLYQLHTVDPAVPLTDSVGALAQLRDEGKVRHVGLSNVTLEQVDEAAALVPIVSVQNRCNVVDRQDVDSGMVSVLGARGIAYLPYGPVGGFHGHRRLHQLPSLMKLAEVAGTSTYQLVLAWLLNLGEHVIPIPGATRIESVEDSLDAGGLTLGAATLAAIDTLRAPA